jgi:hypothetical protein
LLGDLKGLEIGTLHMERNEDSGEEELAYVPGRPEEDPLFRCLRGELEERLAEASPSARPGAAGDDPLLLRGDDHARDRPGAGGGRVAGLAGACLGGGASAGALKDLAARGAFDRPLEGRAAESAERPRGIADEGGGRRKPGIDEGARCRREYRMMEKTLKQDEIDALFRGRAQLDAGLFARTEVRARVVPYNFSSAGRSRPSSCAPSAC